MCGDQSLCTTKLWTTFQAPRCDKFSALLQFIHLASWRTSDLENLSSAFRHALPLLLPYKTRRALPPSLLLLAFLGLLRQHLRLRALLARQREIGFVRLVALLVHRASLDDQLLAPLVSVPRASTLRVREETLFFKGRRSLS